MSQGDDDGGRGGRPPVGASIMPVVVEVPLFTLAELRDFEQIAEETLQAALKLRSKTRHMRRVIEDAEARWAREKVEALREAPELRLVEPTEKKGSTK